VCCKRGSSINEAANLMIQRSMHTTAKDAPDYCCRSVGIGLEERCWGSLLDFTMQLQVNSLCQQLGIRQPYHR
jgi:hypothetical protein